MLFVIYNDTSQTSTKNMSEKIIEVAKMLEETFTTIDYINIKDIKEEKHIYITAVKKI